jgi:hypothetical protein
MDFHLSLRPTDGTPLQDPSRYRHLVGSLVYLTVTRLDIAHAVQILSQFVSAPTSVHYGHLLRVLRYLRGTKHNVYFMTQILHFSFMLTLMLPRPVILQTVAPSLVTVFFLDHPLLLGNSKSKLLYLDLVLKQNFEPWLLLLLRLSGFVGSWLI